jgi:hypothetical protein
MKVMMIMFIFSLSSVVNFFYLKKTHNVGKKHKLKLAEQFCKEVINMSERSCKYVWGHFTLRKYS